MKDNKEILQEAFFKKAKPLDKLKKNLAKYEPVSSKFGNSGFGSPLESGDSFGIVDANEVKKRLTNTFGQIFGNNNIRALASRSIKSFPILVSDNLEPETNVMLKKLLEEQYAEYINLLVSNNVVDLSSFRSGESEGNIAIQALNSISGGDSLSQRLGRKSAKGTLTTDDFISNTLIYNLIRQEAVDITSENELFSELFENALIIESKYEDALLEYLEKNNDKIVNLLEATP